MSIKTIDVSIWGLKEAQTLTCAAKTTKQTDDTSFSQ